MNTIRREGITTATIKELEKQVFKLASNHETLEGVRAEMRGHRIDRHGEIA